MLEASTYAVKADAHFAVLDHDGSDALAAGELLQVQPGLRTKREVDLIIFRADSVQLILQGVRETEQSGWVYKTIALAKLLPPIRARAASWRAAAIDVQV